VFEPVWRIVEGLGLTWVQHKGKYQLLETDGLRRVGLLRMGH
jgi:hypothetical protein